MPFKNLLKGLDNSRISLCILLKNLSLNPRSKEMSRTRDLFRCRFNLLYIVTLNHVLRTTLAAFWAAVQILYSTMGGQSKQFICKTPSEILTKKSTVPLKSSKLKILFNRGFEGQSLTLLLRAQERSWNTQIAKPQRSQC